MFVLSVFAVLAARALALVCAHDSQLEALAVALAAARALAGATLAML